MVRERGGPRPVVQVYSFGVYEPTGCYAQYVSSQRSARLNQSIVPADWVNSIGIFASRLLGVHIVSGPTHRESRVSVTAQISAACARCITPCARESAG